VLVQEGLTGEIVLWTFFARRIQTLWAHVHKMWLHARPSNPMLESANEMASAEVDAWVKSILDEGTMADLRLHPTPLCQHMPPTQVRAPCRLS
jgi:hypothetical protein